MKNEISIFVTTGMILDDSKTLFYPQDLVFNEKSPHIFSLSIEL